jgi:hypothetical protein
MKAQSYSLSLLQEAKAKNDERLAAIVTPEQEQQINESIMDAIPIAANIVKKAMMKTAATGEKPTFLGILKHAMGVAKNEGLALPESEIKNQLPEHGNTDTT